MVIVEFPDYLKLIFLGTHLLLPKLCKVELTFQSIDSQKAIVAAYFMLFRNKNLNNSVDQHNK